MNNDDFNVYEAGLIVEMISQLLPFNQYGFD